MKRNKKHLGLICKIEPTRRKSWSFLGRCVSKLELGNKGINKGIQHLFLVLFALVVLFFPLENIFSQVHVSEDMIPDYSAFTDDKSRSSKYPETHKNDEGEKIGKLNWISYILQEIAKGISILIFPATILSIAISGIRYVISYGNGDQVNKAKKALLHSIVGFFVALFAYAIVYNILNMIKGASQVSYEDSEKK